MSLPRLAMPDPEQLKDAAALVNTHRGGGVIAVTITLDEWLRQTELGRLHPRSREMKAIDAALKAYHDGGKRENGFVALKMAFDNWVRAQGSSGKSWTQSDRNKSGAVSTLHQQILLVDANRSVQLMADTPEWEARKALVSAEREAMTRLFEGRRLIFKDARWKSDLVNAVHTWGTPAASAGMAVKKLVTTGVAAVGPNSVSDALRNTLGGQDPAALFQQLGVSFEGFTHAAEHIVGAAVAPAKLLIDIALASKMVSDRVRVNRERFMFRPGQADAALQCIIRLIDVDLAVIGVDMAKQVSSIVASSFGAAPIASAANAIVSTMVNLKLYAMMADEMRKGDEQLRLGNYSLDLFDVSPLLGCYFIVMADTSVWVNFSVHDMGTPEWKTTVESMVKRAQPVREKARSYIRAARFALSGTEGFNGIEWEPSWRNNKLEFLARFVSTRSDRQGATDYVIGEVKKRREKPMIGPSATVNPLTEGRIAGIRSRFA
jgi:hypothetical protein